MARDFFVYNSKPFRAFGDFLRANPKRARRATSRLLNDFAFGTRTQAIKEIKRTMITRTKKFVEASIRVKTTRAVSIDRQEARTFSFALPRSTGFEQQQTGKKITTTRSATLFARRNDPNKKIRPSLRFKNNGERFLGESDLPNPGKSNQRVPRLIKFMKTKNKRKPFIIKRKYKNIKKGVYLFRRNRMMMVHNLEAKPRTVRPNKWMDRAVSGFFRNANLDEMWRKSMKPFVRKKRFK